ncbi:MAG TPA: hypothetical protein VKS20_06905 [Candidatus Acidoferrales bacterium]|nr:hypothetical protein [Candidatus Acidoferrales bacterium]
MSVTRDVVTDLLPVYFSGEASEDTRRLVEEYFRENPEFERIARKAATPLEALRAAKTIPPEIEKEKRDLVRVQHEVRRRKIMFGLALFFTLVPLAFFYSKGHWVWIVREAPWDAAFFWSWGALLWFLYFTRLPRRAVSLVIAIFFTLFPFALHYAFPGGPGVYTESLSNWVSPFLWGVAALVWFAYFARPRRRTVILVFAIFLTLFPLPFILYSLFVGGSHLWLNWGNPGFFWTMAAFIWLQYFRRRRKGNVDGEC